MSKKTGALGAPACCVAVVLDYKKLDTAAVFAGMRALVRRAAISSAETDADCLVRPALQLHQSQTIGVTGSALPAAIATAGDNSKNRFSDLTAGLDSSLPFEQERGPFSDAI